MTALYSIGNENNYYPENMSRLNNEYFSMSSNPKASGKQNQSVVVDSIAIDPQKIATVPKDQPQASSDQLLSNLRRKKEAARMQASGARESEQHSESPSQPQEASEEERPRRKPTERQAKKKKPRCGTKRRRKTSD